MSLKGTNVTNWESTVAVFCSSQNVHDLVSNTFLTLAPRYRRVQFAFFVPDSILFHSDVPENISYSVTGSPVSLNTNMDAEILLADRSGLILSRLPVPEGLASLEQYLALIPETKKPGLKWMQEWLCSISETPADSTIRSIIENAVHPKRPIILLTESCMGCGIFDQLKSTMRYLQGQYESITILLPDDYSPTDARNLERLFKSVTAVRCIPAEKMEYVRIRQALGLLPSPYFGLVREDKSDNIRFAELWKTPVKD